MRTLSHKNIMLYVLEEVLSSVRVYSDLWIVICTAETTDKLETALK